MQNYTLKFRSLSKRKASLEPTWMSAQTFSWRLSTETCRWLTQIRSRESTMTTELLLGWIGLLAALIAVGVSIYAILDVIREVKKLIRIERNRAYARILNDMAWLFITPTERAHSKEIAKGLEEFSMFAKILNPERTPDISTNTVNNEALAMADRLVTNGYARWNDGWDIEKVKVELQSWQTAKNEVRLANILGKEQKAKSLF